MKRGEWELERDSDGTDFCENGTEKQEQRYIHGVPGLAEREPASEMNYRG